MNPFTTFSNVANSSIANTIAKLRVDNIATHEKTPNKLSGAYADYKLLKNSVTSILISEYSYETSISSSGNAGTWVAATNSNLKQLIADNYSSLPYNRNATLETSYQQYESSVESLYDTETTLVHPSNKLYCTVIDNEFIVYMPPIKSFGKPNGASVGTKQFVSTDGINWTAKDFNIAIDNSNDPSLGVPADRWKAIEYGYSNIALEGASQPNAASGSPFFYWFVKKLNGVYFLWIQENQYKSTASPKYTTAHWHRCWTSIDGINFTKLTSSVEFGYLHAFPKGPYSDECFQYYNGNLIIVSDPVYTLIENQYRFVYYIGVSKDMGLSWTSVYHYTLNKTPLPMYVTGHFMNSENYLLIFDTNKIIQYKFDSNQNLNLSTSWQVLYASKSNPSTPLTLNDNFRCVHRYGNYVAIDSGSTSYFCELDTYAYGVNSGPFLMAAFSSNVMTILGFSSSGTHIITKPNDEVLYYDQVTYAYSVLMSNYNYMSSNNIVVDSSAIDSLANNNWSVVAHHYDSFEGKLILVSYKTVRETTDGVTYTVKKTPAALAAKLRYAGSHTQFMRTTNLYDINYYYIDSNGYKWTISNDFSTATKSLNALPGNLLYPYQPKYYTFHNNTERFLMLVDTTNVAITGADGRSKTYYASKNLFAYSPYNDSVQKITLPDFICKIISDGTYTYAVTPNLNKFYKIWFDLNLNSWQWQAIVVSTNPLFNLRDIVCYTKDAVNTILVLGSYQYGTSSITESNSLAFSTDGGNTFSEYPLHSILVKGQPFTFTWHADTDSNYSNIIAIDTVNNIMYIGWGKYYLTPITLGGSEKIVWTEAWKEAYKTRDLFYTYGSTTYGRTSPTSNAAYIFNDSKKIVRLLSYNVVSSDLKE